LAEDCRRQTRDGLLFSNLSLIIENSKHKYAKNEDFSSFDFANGEIAYPKARDGQDMYFIQGAGYTDVVKLVRQLKQNFKIKDTDLTVVCPYREPLVELNKELRKIWLGADVMLVEDSFKNKWAINDRIIMTENRTDIGVMNGEEGRIMSISNNELICNFDGNDVNIPMSISKKSYGGSSSSSSGGGGGAEEGSANLLCSKLLQLSYALTVHKSQGSEWPIVIYYVPPNKKAGGFLSRRLSFTALSRTKNLCMCVCDDLDVLAGAIICRTSKRIDNLAASYKTVMGIVDPPADGKKAGGGGSSGYDDPDYDPLDGNEYEDCDVPDDIW